MSAPGQPDGIDISEVIAELDDVGRTKWELAVARVTIRHQARRIADLENTTPPPTPPVD